MNIFRLNNLKMDGVKLEDDGVNIEEFEKVLKDKTYILNSRFSKSKCYNI